MNFSRSLSENLCRSPIENPNGVEHASRADLLIPFENHSNRKPSRFFFSRVRARIILENPLDFYHEFLSELF